MEAVMRKIVSSVVTLLTLSLAFLGGMPAVLAQSADEPAVAQAVESLRKAMFARDAKGFEAMISENVSYGHSAGRIENKQEFIKAALANKSVMKSLTFTDQTVKITGNHAVVRNTYNSESELDGKPASTKIGVLMVWAKEGTTWRLFARQAYRL
jgi:ketosteroid isomerase-like protein